MTTIDGWAHTHYGPSGMLYTEALFGVVGLTLFTVVFTLAKRFWRQAPEPAPAA